ncbi:MAG TPA: hypothetical protein VGK71_08165 [Nitrospirota bacterium]
MSVYKKQDVEGAIIRKCKTEFRDGSERNAWYEYNGIKILRVTIPKGRGDITPGTLSSIKNQLKLTREEFDKFIKCTFTATDFEEKMRNLGYIK